MGVNPAVSLLSAEEVVGRLSDDARRKIEDWLEGYFSRKQLEPGDIVITAILSKVADDKWGVVLDYMKAGVDLGQATDLVGIAGRCMGFDDLLERFIEAERKYADAGFVPVSIELFEGWVGWGRHRDLLAAMGEQNPERAAVVLYGLVYQRSFAPERYKSGPVQRVFATGEMMMGNYLHPSADKALTNMPEAERAQVLYQPSRA